MRVAGYGKFNKREQRRSIAFVMVLIMLAISVSTFCCNASAADFQSGTSVKVEQGGKGTQLGGCHDECPSCPDDGHSNSHQCDSCSCPCHAAMMHMAFEFVSSSFTAPLTSQEPFRFLPDVYLTKFIPPQNQA